STLRNSSCPLSKAARCSPLKPASGSPTDGAAGAGGGPTGGFPPRGWALAAPSRERRPGRHSAVSRPAATKNALLRITLPPRTGRSRGRPTRRRPRIALRPVSPCEPQDWGGRSLLFCGGNSVGTLGETQQTVVP